MEVRVRERWRVGWIEETESGKERLGLSCSVTMYESHKGDRTDQEELLIGMLKIVTSKMSCAQVKEGVVKDSP